ncbi:MAG: zinc-dependent alcohol dehydrogenase family protein [Litorivicinaceae bacterium]
MKTRISLLPRMGFDRPFSVTNPLQVVEAELADPGPEEVLVKILAAGVCHSDLSVINGDRPRPTPVALGHEAVGEVVKVGPGSSDLKAGQRVSMVFVPSCGYCDCCAEGRPALCEPGLEHNTNGSLLSGAKRISVNGETINHHLGISCFSDYAVSHRRSLVPIESDLDPTVQAVFGCAVLTGCGAVLNTARMHAGERVAIVGLGGVGLSALLGAYAGGARQIIAVDANPEKETLARELGADHFVDARDPDAAAQVRVLSSGGVHLAAEFAGVMPALDLAIEVTRRGGRTVTAALPNPSDRLSVAAARLVTEERALMGSYVGSCVPSRDIPNFIALHKKGLLPVERMISHTLDLSEINTAMERLAGGQAVRQIVCFE